MESPQRGVTPTRTIKIDEWPIEAWWFGVFLSVSGTALLAIFVNLLTAFLAAITLTTYLFLYSPAKRRTSLCTLIGAPFKDYFTDPERAAASERWPMARIPRLSP